jgi:hypothetical protein
LECVRFIAALVPIELLATTVGHGTSESGAQAHALQTLARLLLDSLEVTAFCSAEIP